MWQAFLVSTGVVALGEIGDKTQLLALLLAARFRKPVPIILGILVATLANHAGASALGNWITRSVDPQWLRWGLGLSFLVVAVWMLIPDQADEVKAEGTSRFGVFGITTVAFFIAEMGDKTQIATVMLAAKFDSLWSTFLSFPAKRFPVGEADTSREASATLSPPRSTSATKDDSTIGGDCLRRDFRSESAASPPATDA